LIHRKYSDFKDKKNNLQLFFNCAEENTKIKIFRIATELFSINGYEGVSIREISRNVGIKESSIYNHFKSKEDILNKIIDYFEIEIKKSELSTEEKKEVAFLNPPLSLLKKSMQKFIEFADNPLMSKIYRILIIEQFKNKRAKDLLLYCFLNGPEKSLESYFNLLMNQGLIITDDPRMLATEYANTIFSLVYKLSLLDSYNKNTYEIEDCIWDYINYFSKKVSVIK